MDPPSRLTGSPSPSAVGFWPPKPSNINSSHPRGGSSPGRSQIIPTDNDVIAGRGVNIAQHPGNERFRALVTTRFDQAYCHSYTSAEKKAVADEIIHFIRSLNPPGRFLKRVGRSKGSRGLEGPWEELSEKEVIKKTTQALRDCNRPDRTGYAASVTIPDDVRRDQQLRSMAGLSNKEYASQAAEAAMKEAELASEGQGITGPRTEFEDASSAAMTSVSPAAIYTEEMAEPWAKRQRLNDPSEATPLLWRGAPATVSTGGTTAAGASATLHRDSAETTPSTTDQLDNPYLHLEHHNMASSPILAGYEDAAAAAAAALDEEAFPFAGADEKPRATLQPRPLHPDSAELVDPLHMAAAAALEDGRGHHRHRLSSSSSLFHESSLPPDDLPTVHPIHEEDYHPPPQPSPLHSDSHSHTGDFSDANFEDENDH